MNDTPSSTGRATLALADLFLGILSEGAPPSFESFEDRAIRIGHEAIARAMGLALGRFDERLCLDLPRGARA